MHLCVCVCVCMCVCVYVQYIVKMSGNTAHTKRKM